MEICIHPNFKLNGKSFSVLELLAEALYLQKSTSLFNQSIGNFLIEWLNNEDFLLVKTSGSTGKPKQIILYKKAMIASASATISHFNLQPTNKALLCLSANYIAGKMMLVRALSFGLHLDTIEPSANPLEKKNEEYDFVAMVPMQIEASLQKLHLIKTLIIGGAKVDFSLATQILKTKCNAYETYGMTETISHIAVKKVGEKAFSILPNIRIAKDERNCLVIECSVLSNEKIYTNDIVELLTENSFILKGRLDNVINSGGIKIFPEEIEEKLAPFFSTRFFIGSLPDIKFGNKVILLIESEVYTLDSKIFSELNRYEVPKEIVFISKFEETETNKINRKKTLEKMT